MGDDQGDGEAPTAEEVPVLPDLKPSTQVGWIFRDGDFVAIERHGEETDRLSTVLAD